MNCFYCDQPMPPDSAETAVWGARTVVVHKACDRQVLEARAHQLGASVEGSEWEIIAAIMQAKFWQGLARKGPLSRSGEPPAWEQMK